jgi:hypothetical protein
MASKDGLQNGSSFSLAVIGLAHFSHFAISVIEPSSRNRAALGWFTAIGALERAHYRVVLVLDLIDPAE